MSAEKIPFAKFTFSKKDRLVAFTDLEQISSKIHDKLQQAIDNGILQEESLGSEHMTIYPVSQEILDTLGIQTEAIRSAIATIDRINDMREEEEKMEEEGFPKSSYLVEDGDQHFVSMILDEEKIEHRISEIVADGFRSLYIPESAEINDEDLESLIEQQKEARTYEYEAIQFFSDNTEKINSMITEDQLIPVGFTSAEDMQAITEWLNNCGHEEKDDKDGNRKYEVSLVEFKFSESNTPSGKHLLFVHEDNFTEVITDLLSQFFSEESENTEIELDELQHILEDEAPSLDPLQNNPDEQDPDSISDQQVINR